MIGNEANGLDRELMQRADSKIKIPLSGKIESLNAAQAAAVIAFEISAQEIKST
jgi:TrmH family RNA methyltransferase